MANIRVKDTVAKARTLNKKIVLGIFSILMCLALIVVCSFTNFIIDPKQWQTKEFLTDELIIVAIVIMSMISVMFIGQAGNAQNADSKLAKARVEFFKSVAEVIAKGVSAFRQWIKKVLQPDDVKSVKERRLRQLGIDDVLILELDDTQLRSLLQNAGRFPVERADNEADRKGRYFKKITEEQLKGIEKIRQTEFKMRFVEPEYYLSVKNLTDTRTVSERALNEDKKKRFYLSSSVISKLAVTIVSAMIFASLVKDLTDIDTATALAKFFSRLWAMISSSFMGYIVGVQMNDIDAEYINMRVQVHTRYLQDTNFKPLSQQEEARQEFVDRVKEEQVLQLDNKSNQIEMK